MFGYGEIMFDDTETMEDPPCTCTIHEIIGAAATAYRVSDPSVPFTSHTAIGSVTKLAQPVTVRGKLGRRFKVTIKLNGADARTVSLFMSENAAKTINAALAARKPISEVVHVSIRIMPVADWIVDPDTYH